MNIGVHLLLFLLYSVAGAALERFAYWSDVQRSKRKGLPLPPEKEIYKPVLVLFGIGAYLVVAFRALFARMRLAWPLEMIGYGVVITAFEYVWGLCEGAGPESVNHDTNKVVAWDYSRNPFNYRGIIDLQHFVAYALLGFAVSRIHPILVDKFTALVSR